MLYKFEKHLLNLFILFDLCKMNKTITGDFSKDIKKQNRNIKKLVKRAYKIPFYKERFDSCNIKPSDIKNADDFSKLPILTKDELRSWMNKESENPKYKNWYHDTTSGSTGAPLMLLYSPKEKAYNMANWMRVMIKAGYNPFFGKTMGRKSGANAISEKQSLFQKMGILRKVFVEQFKPEKDVINQINAYNPDFIYMNKSEFMKICLYCKKNNIHLNKPKFYCPVGEKIDTTSRSVFEDILGNNIIDSYGTIETGAIMMKRAEDKEYFIHHDSFAVNVYDEDNKPAKEGKIIVTPLYKTDLPLINYCIGDIATCETRQGIRFITEIQGRASDSFRYKTGEVTSFFEISSIISHFRDLLQIRFIQKTYDDVLVQCVRNNEISTKTTTQIEKELTEKLNAKFKYPLRLEYVWLESIPPDENGKIRIVVSQIN